MTGAPWWAETPQGPPGHWRDLGGCGWLLCEGMRRWEWGERTIQGEEGTPAACQARSPLALSQHCLSLAWSHGPLSPHTQHPGLVPTAPWCHCQDPDPKCNLCPVVGVRSGCCSQALPVLLVPPAFNSWDGWACVQTFSLLLGNFTVLPTGLGEAILSSPRDGQEPPDKSSQPPPRCGGLK